MITTGNFLSILLLRYYSVFSNTNIDIIKNKEDIYQQIVVASLLGDGLSSGVVVGPEHPLYAKLKSNGKAAYIVDSYSHIVPDTSADLGSHLTERYFP